MPTSLILNGELRFSILSVPENSSQMRFTVYGAAGLPLCSGSLMDIHSYSSVHRINQMIKEGNFDVNKGEFKN